MPASDAIVQAQLSSLDDTDCYASVWDDILTKQREDETSTSASTSVPSSLWGGRGKGGRGLARRTVQPKDIVVEDVRMQYLLGDICLEGATIKLLQQRVYALIGTNGCGKSTLLRRINSQKIPGWSTQWSSLYLPPELPNKYLSMTPLEVILEYHEQIHQHSTAATESRIEELEAQLEALNVEEEQEEMEALCEELSKLEDQLESEGPSVEKQAREALDEFGIDENTITQSCSELSLGQQKRVLLSVALICSFTNLLLFDEPANNLDIFGLIQLRRLIESSSATVVLVSHDVDLINDVATEIIDMHTQKLWYYPGNYDSYRLMREQQGLHELRQHAANEKKRDQLLNKIQNLKEKPMPKRGGAKKKHKAIGSQRKKLERHEASSERTTNGTSSVFPIRKGLTAAQRLKLAEATKKEPDKAVQFVFPDATCTWGEPLITVLDVGHGFDEEAMAANQVQPEDEDEGKFKITRKDGYLFDCVDICIEEGSRNCILGPTASGKSTLLKILAKKCSPTEGTVHHASGIRVGYFDPEVVDEIISALSPTTTAIDYLTSKYPEKTDQELRGHLTGFGLSPTTQAKTPICYLSGGEKCRFVLASIMMDYPPVLCLNSPTSCFDVESVEALIYGLRHWSGTLVMVSQDANFLRSLEDVKCVVLMPEEGKLRRVAGGMDAYLKSFKF